MKNWRINMMAAPKMTLNIRQKNEKFKMRCDGDLYIIAMSKVIRVACHVTCAIGATVIVPIGIMYSYKKGFNEGVKHESERFNKTYVGVERPIYDAGGCMPFDQAYNTYARIEYHHRQSIFPPPHWKDEVLKKCSDI